VTVVSSFVKTVVLGVVALAGALRMVGAIKSGLGLVSADSNQDPWTGWSAMLIRSISLRDSIERHCHLATRASDPSRGRLRSVGKASLSSRYLRTARRMIVESPAAGLLPTGVGG
jgi:hypothetical protein